MSASQSPPRGAPPPPPPPGLGMPRAVNPIPRRSGVPAAPAMGLPSVATLRDIVDKGRPCDSFFMAAAPSLVNALKFRDGEGRQRWHTYFFKNMVATILLETRNRTPAGSKSDHYNAALNLGIDVFNWMSKEGQLALLHNLWRDCYEAVAPDLDPGDMVDGSGDASAGGKSALPSSIRPADGGGFFVKIAAGPVGNAWKTHGVGFRIDGGKALEGTRDDLSRIAREGMTALQKNPDLAVRIVKKYYHEHASCRSNDLYFGYQNRDLYNESGICVSRSLFGATAFPNRHTHNRNANAPSDAGGDLDFQYLYAVNCQGLKGIDTEKKQIEFGQNSLWRPGEKAFARVPKENVLGWVKVVRQGQQAAENRLLGATGWSFMLPKTEWTWINEPAGPVKQYLVDELGAWTAGKVYHVSSEYDFLTNSA